jgi:hypothetical protein
MIDFNRYGVEGAAQGGGIVNARTRWLGVGFILLIGILSIGLLAAAYSRSDFLFLDQIEAGMTGIGKTVVAGDVISEFSVDVLGIIDEPGTASDFIVVQVSGEAIGRSGGIAQGMSGSPIYVDGKLIGALSRAAEWSKAITPIGLVTPIEQMLGLIDEVDGKVSCTPADPAAVLAGVSVREVAARPTAQTVRGAPDTLFAYPVASPLLVTGLSGRSLDALMQGENAVQAPSGLLADFLPQTIGSAPHGLASLGMRLVPMAGETKAKTDTAQTAPLEPGSAIGVALASGDITIGALGTLTFDDGTAIVGFGHPFLSTGTTDFPLTTAHIYDTMKSYDASFKLGMLGDSIGSILADRSAGVAGRVGRTADLVRLSLAVLDRDTGGMMTFKVGLVREPLVLPNLLLASGIEAVDQALDRIGQGTVEVDYQIAGNGLPSPLERHDVFLSTQDIAVFPPWQIADLVGFLEYNDFAAPKITRITASMQITQDLKAMHINHLALDKPVYAPGDTIHYAVDLQTYHGKVVTQTGAITIPEGLSADEITVRAYSGPRLLEAGESPEEFTSLGEIISAIEDLPSYDTLTVELFAPNPLSPSGEGLEGIDKVRTQVSGYFLYDQRQLTVPLLSSGG